MRKIIFVALTLSIALAAASCGSRGPDNTVYSADDAQGKIIGVLSGTSSAPYASALGEAVAYSSSSQLMDALKSGSLDCVIMEKPAGDKLAKKTSYVKTLSEPLFERDLCFAVAKENADLTRDINAVLKSLGSSGVLASLNDKYMKGRDYTYTPPSVSEPTAALTLAIPGDYPPYVYKNADGEYEGLDIEIARAVCALLGVKLIILETEMSKLVTTVQFGKADFALGGVHINDADAELVDFSISYAQLIQVVLVRS